MVRFFSWSLNAVGTREVRKVELSYMLMERKKLRQKSERRWLQKSAPIQFLLQVAHSTWGTKTEGMKAEISAAKMLPRWSYELINDPSCNFHETEFREITGTMAVITTFNKPYKSSDQKQAIPISASMNLGEKMIPEMKNTVIHQ